MIVGNIWAYLPVQQFQIYVSLFENFQKIQHFLLNQKLDTKIKIKQNRLMYLKRNLHELDMGDETLMHVRNAFLTMMEAQVLLLRNVSAKYILDFTSQENALIGWDALTIVVTFP